MKFPWTKRKRGQYRSAAQRAKEEQSNIDFMMLQAWKEDLREHPEYLRQVTRQKFGMTDMGEGESRYQEPDFIDKMHEVADAKSGFDSIFGGGSKPGGGFMGMLSDIIKQDKDGDIGKAVAGLITLVTGKVAQPGQQSQITRVEPEQIAQPQPEQLAEPQPKTKEEKMVAFITQLMDMSPEEAALNIYQHKDNPKDIRYMIYTYATENDFDSIVESIPEITTNPGNEFLVPLAGKLDRKWMALVYDELNTLRRKDEENI